MAFEDSCCPGRQREREFAEIMHQPNTDVAEMMRALRGILPENDMMAMAILPRRTACLNCTRCLNLPEAFTCTATRRRAIT